MPREGKCISPKLRLSTMGREPTTLLTNNITPKTGTPRTEGTFPPWADTVDTVTAISMAPHKPNCKSCLLETEVVSCKLSVDDVDFVPKCVPEKAPSQE